MNGSTPPHPRRVRRHASPADSFLADLGSTCGHGFRELPIRKVCSEVWKMHRHTLPIKYKS
jgi:hypothetical protein